MNRVVAFFKVLMRLSSVSLLCMMFSTAYANNDISNAASRINGESLVYFVLLALILYLFFRKPLP